MKSRFCYFDNFHPFSMLIYFLSVTLPLFFTKNPIILCLGFVCSLCYLGEAFGLDKLRTTLKFVVVLFVLTSLTNPLFSHNGYTPLFFMNDNPITLEALLYGVDIAFMLCSVIVWFSAFNEIMTTEKLLVIFSHPFVKLSVVLSTSLRLIPCIKADYKSVYNANVLGFKKANSSLVEKALFSLKIFGAVINRTLENAMITAENMSAKGYKNGVKRFNLFRFKAQDLRLIFISALLFIVFLLGCQYGVNNYSFYPYLSDIPMNSYCVLVYISYGILCALPIILQLKEELKWNYLISKI